MVINSPRFRSERLVGVGSNAGRLILPCINVHVVMLI